MAQNDPYPFRKILERSWSDLSLELLLNDLHFENGRLVLHCTALLPGVYYDEVELELESAKNPVPQRGNILCLLLFFTNEIKLK